MGLVAQRRLVSVRVGLRAGARVRARARVMDRAKVGVSSAAQPRAAVTARRRRAAPG